LQGLLAMWARKVKGMSFGTWLLKRRIRKKVNKTAKSGVKRLNKMLK